MTGCLTLPFRIVSFLLVAALVVVGWWYREEIHRFARRQVGMAEVANPVGRPAAGGAESARVRMEALSGSQADSVVLTAGEVAALVVDHLRQARVPVPDSLEVELKDREVAVRARVPTDPLPAAIRDILGGALRDREGVEVSGPLALRRAGVGEFEVRRVRVRGLPVPRELLDRLLARYLPGSPGTTVLFDVPATVSGVRVTPAGVTLYGGGAR